MKNIRKFVQDLICYLPNNSDGGDEESNNKKSQEATIEDLSNACAHGDIEGVKTILSSGKVNVNAEDSVWDAL